MSTEQNVIVKHALDSLVYKLDKIIIEGLLTQIRKVDLKWFFIISCASHFQFKLQLNLSKTATLKYQCFFSRPIIA